MHDHETCAVAVPSHTRHTRHARQKSHGAHGAVSVWGCALEPARRRNAKILELGGGSGPPSAKTLELGGGVKRCPVLRPPWVRSSPALMRHDVLRGTSVGRCDQAGRGSHRALARGTHLPFDKDGMRAPLLHHPSLSPIAVTTRASRARCAEAPLEQTAKRWLQLVLKPTFTALTPRNVHAGRV